MLLGEQRVPKVLRSLGRSLEAFFLCACAFLEGELPTHFGRHQLASPQSHGDPHPDSSPLTCTVTSEIRVRKKVDATNFSLDVMGIARPGEP